VITRHKKLNGSACQDGAGTRVELAPRPIRQHDIVLDLDRQEPLVGRPHVQTPRGNSDTQGIRRVALGGQPPIGVNLRLGCRGCETVFFWG
jgi:hypothetical protein